MLRPALWEFGDRMSPRGHGVFFQRRAGQEFFHPTAIKVSSEIPAEEGEVVRKVFVSKKIKKYKLNYYQGGGEGAGGAGESYFADCI